MTSTRLVLISGNTPSVWRNVVRSRGRAEPSATLARIRSISPTERKSWRKVSYKRVSSSTPMLLCRNCRRFKSRMGSVIQRRNKRPPIGVIVESMMPARVCSLRPSGWCSNSRLRRVAASRCRWLCGFSIWIARRWGRAVRCVSFAYWSSAPATAMAAGSSSMPKPARSRVPNCSVNR